MIIGKIKEGVDYQNIDIDLFKNCGDLEENVKKMFISILKNPEYEYFVCDDISNKHVPCYYEILD